MNASTYTVIIILVLALLAIIFSKRSEIEYAKAKRHSSWSNGLMYLTLAVCIIAILFAEFGIKGFKGTLRNGTATLEIMDGTSSLDEPLSYEKGGRAEKIGTDKLNKVLSDWLKKIKSSLEDN